VGVGSQLQGSQLHSSAYKGLLTAAVSGAADSIDRATSQAAQVQANAASLTAQGMTALANVGQSFVQAHSANTAAAASASAAASGQGFAALANVGTHLVTAIADARRADADARLATAELHGRMFTTVVSALAPVLHSFAGVTASAGGGVQGGGGGGGGGVPSCQKAGCSAPAFWTGSTYKNSCIDCLN